MTPRDHLFVYGTLCDPGVAEAVLGEAWPRWRPVPARLEGHAARYAEGEHFPVLTAGGGGAEGWLLHDVTEAAWARLLYYEDTDYSLHEADVLLTQSGGRCRATLFWPGDALVPSTRVWTGPQNLPALRAAVRDYMASFGTGADAETIWAAAKARAGLGL